MYKSFLTKYFVVLLLIVTLFVPIGLFLYKIQEVSSIDNIVKRQLNANSLYGTALNENMFLYKLELIKETKPEVIAIGSSRVMQFRQDFFRTKFITSGGATNHLNEGVDFLNEVLKIHKPKVIILGLDMWWFNDNFHQPFYYNHQETTSDMSFAKLKNTLLWLFNEKISINQFLAVLFNKDDKNKITNFDNIGIAALKTSDGFRKDGSYFYSKTIFGVEQSEDIKFANTLERIRNGNRRFENGSKVSQERWKDLERFLAICKKNNIEILIFTPPFANETINNLTKEKNKYLYIDEFRQKIVAIGGYDFHDPKVLGSNDCEFIDGFHGGDVTYQRILLNMAQKNQNLKDYVNISLLSQSIEKNNGKAFSIFDEDKDMYLKEEIDFLQLGCTK